jgi:hypothetical protein
MIQELYEFLQYESPNKKQHINLEDIYKSAIVDTEHMKHIAKLLFDNQDKFSNSYSLLNVGIGYNLPPIWQNLFKNIFQYSKIANIEVWLPYIQNWQYKEFPVWQGDIRNIKNSLPPKSVDTILWAQGPEHIEQDEIPIVYNDIKNIARHSIIFITPWGKYYDYQENWNNNPFEAHVAKNMDVDSYKYTNLQTLTVSTKDQPDAAMFAYEFLT